MHQSSEEHEALVRQQLLSLQDASGAGRKTDTHSCSLYVTAARQSFKEHEALVYQQLAQLIRDGVWLKSYIAAVMRVEQVRIQTQQDACSECLPTGFCVRSLWFEGSAAAQHLSAVRACAGGNLTAYRTVCWPTGVCMPE